MNNQTKINQQIKLALDKLARLDADMLVGYWDDYLHSPRDIDGIQLNRRWNKITLAAMLEDIKISIS
jgi:hypothetical protein